MLKAFAMAATISDAFTGFADKGFAVNSFDFMISLAVFDACDMLRHNVFCALGVRDMSTTWHEYEAFDGDKLERERLERVHLGRLNITFGAEKTHVLSIEDPETFRKTKFAVTASADVIVEKSVTRASDADRPLIVYSTAANITAEDKLAGLASAIAFERIIATSFRHEAVRWNRLACPLVLRQTTCSSASNKKTQQVWTLTTLRLSSNLLSSRMTAESMITSTATMTAKTTTLDSTFCSLCIFKIKILLFQKCTRFGKLLFFANAILNHHDELPVLFWHIHGQA